MDTISDALTQMSDGGIRKIVISKPSSKQESYRKITAERTSNGNAADCYQIACYTEKQVFHENIGQADLVRRLAELMEGHFLRANGWSAEYEFILMVSKKGKCTYKKKRLTDGEKTDPNMVVQSKDGGIRNSVGSPFTSHISETVSASENTFSKASSHNRVKNYILQEGQAIAPLVDMGIFTAEGKVVRSMYDKYRQINRFVEIIDDELSQWKHSGKRQQQPDSAFRDGAPDDCSLCEGTQPGKQNAMQSRGYPDGAPDEHSLCDATCLKDQMIDRTIRVIDFGCGKSYLTFVLYYYLTEILGIRAEVIGLDLKADVIDKCNQSARKYGYDGLRFEVGDINGYQPPFDVDMVISLHACDTATDYALYNAVSWNARLIFSVPCCQHELNGQIQTDHFAILTRYGIIKERFAALATDAIRGNLLEYRGYKTQLLEFIDFEHTPKNILIRAVKRDMVPKSVREKALHEAEALMEEFSLKPTLHRLLV